mmetsp:Transcript_123782/g.214591  ORF Transcript_123782/g.214591 Transcript_123782/m.214591 type:complete len:82 (+) Transcript_123782:94-339(+)
MTSETEEKKVKDKKIKKKGSRMQTFLLGFALLVCIVVFLSATGQLDYFKTQAKWFMKELYMSRGIIVGGGFLIIVILLTPA